MKIPKRFHLLGTTYTVRIIPAAKWPDDSAVAFFDPSNCLIALKAGLSTEMREHSYLHELSHAVLHAMNHALYEDEAFVDVFSGLLHQALK